jgi:competence protein ComGC
MNGKGFTLVELLVSSIIVMLSIAAIVSMLRKGREIDVNDRYRRNARAIVNSRFESPQFDYTRYSVLLTQTGVTTENNIVIDSLANGTVITGTLTTTIEAAITTPASDGVNVPYIPITINLAWQTIDGNDNIIITKFITQ